MATPIYDAIMQLRPEFGIRDKIRAWLEDIICKRDGISANNYLYTIPREIAMIISDMVPDLRQTGEQALINIESKFKQFMDKYQIKADNYTKSENVKTPQLDRMLLIHDFPQYANEFMEHQTMIKLINGNVSVTYNRDYQYVGNNAFYCDVNSNGPFVIQNGKVQLLANMKKHIVCVLPCGLVIEYQNKNYLPQLHLTDCVKNVEIQVNDVVDIDDSPITTYSGHYIDDYGVLHHTNNWIQLTFSDLHPRSMSAILR